MKPRLLLAVVAIATLVTVASAGAQQGVRNGPPGDGRAQAAHSMRERRQAMARRMRNMTPEQRTVVRELVKARLDSLTPAQREVIRDRWAQARPPVDPAYARAVGEERRRIRDEVKAGTLDRHAAAEQLREWMKAHHPTAPGGGGE